MLRGQRGRLPHARAGARQRRRPLHVVRGLRPDLSGARSAVLAAVGSLVDFRRLMLAIEVKATTHPGPADTIGLRLFREEYRDRFAGGLLLHGGRDTQWMGTGCSPRPGGVCRSRTAAPESKIALRLGDRGRDPGGSAPSGTGGRGRLGPEPEIAQGCVEDTGPAAVRGGASRGWGGAPPRTAPSRRRRWGRRAEPRTLRCRRRGWRARCATTAASASSHAANSGSRSAPRELVGRDVAPGRADEAEGTVVPHEGAPKESFRRAESCLRPAPEARAAHLAAPDVEAAYRALRMLARGPVRPAPRCRASPGPSRHRRTARRSGPSRRSRVHPDEQHLARLGAVPLQVSAGAAPRRSRGARIRSPPAARTAGSACAPAAARQLPPARIRGCLFGASCLTSVQPRPRVPIHANDLEPVEPKRWPRCAASPGSAATLGNVASELILPALRPDSMPATRHGVTIFAAPPSAEADVEAPDLDLVNRLRDEP